MFAGQGFAVLNAAPNTTLNGNKASLNRVNFCDQGVGTILVGNSFLAPDGTCDISHPSDPRRRPSLVHGGSPSNPFVGSGGR